MIVETTLAGHEVVYSTRALLFLERKTKLTLSEMMTKYGDGFSAEISVDLLWSGLVERDRSFMEINAANEDRVIDIVDKLGGLGPTAIQITKLFEDAFPQEGDPGADARGKPARRPKGKKKAGSG